MLDGEAEQPRAALARERLGGVDERGAGALALRVGLERVELHQRAEVGVDLVVLAAREHERGAREAAGAKGEEERAVAALLDREAAQQVRRELGQVTLVARPDVDLHQTKLSWYVGSSIATAAWVSCSG